MMNARKMMLGTNWGECSYCWKEDIGRDSLMIEFINQEYTKKKIIVWLKNKPWTDDVLLKQLKYHLILVNVCSY